MTGLSAVAVTWDDCPWYGRIIAGVLLWIGISVLGAALWALMKRRIPGTVLGDDIPDVNENTQADAVFRAAALSAYRSGRPVDDAWLKALADELDAMERQVRGDLND